MRPKEWQEIKPNYKEWLKFLKSFRKEYMKDFTPRRKYILEKIYLRAMKQKEPFTYNQLFNVVKKVVRSKGTFDKDIRFFEERGFIIRTQLPQIGDWRYKFIILEENIRKLLIPTEREIFNNGLKLAGDLLKKLRKNPNSVDKLWEEFKNRFILDSINKLFEIHVLRIWNPYIRAWAWDRLISGIVVILEFVFEAIVSPYLPDKREELHKMAPPHIDLETQRKLFVELFMGIGGEKK